MNQPLLENSSQVSLIHRNQEIQTLASDAAHEPFAECIRLRRSEWSFENAQVHRLQSQIELRRVDAVAVVDEESVRFLSSDDLAKLLKYPACRRMSRDVDVGDPACAYLHDHK